MNPEYDYINDPHYYYYDDYFKEDSNSNNNFSEIKGKTASNRTDTNSNSSNNSIKVQR